MHRSSVLALLHPMKDSAAEHAECWLAAAWNPRNMHFSTSLRTMIVVVAFLVTGCRAHHHRSDADLDENFKEHRPAINALLLMAQQDSHMARIAPDFTWLTTDVSWPRENIGISAERWSEYRRLFKETGIELGISRPEGSETIFFIVSATGLVTGGSDKGYAFSSEPLLPVLRSLDNGPQELKSGQPGYRPMDDGWYIYYRWDD